MYLHPAFFNLKKYTMILEQDLFPGAFFEYNGEAWRLGKNINPSSVHLFRFKEAALEKSKVVQIEELKPLKISSHILERLDFKPIYVPDDEVTVYAIQIYKSLETYIDSTQPELGKKLIRPATYIAINFKEDLTRYTTYLKNGENKIYLYELQYVHELQSMLIGFTRKFSYTEI